MRGRKILLLWIIVVLTIFSILLIAKPSEAHASVTNATRWTDDEIQNDVSPLVAPIRYQGDVVVTDECYTGGDPEFEGYRWKVAYNEAQVGWIYEGTGDGHFDVSLNTPQGNYAPYIYFWNETSDYDNLAEACSSSEIFVPFEVILEEEEATTTPEEIESMNMLGWLLGGIVVAMLPLILLGIALRAMREETI